MANKSKKNTHYHHGDLRTSLIDTATKMLAESSIENLSLRKLAERIGVSRTAAYHHFTNKNDLLSAIAAQGFVTWQTQAKIIFNDTHLSDREKYRQFAHNYVKFAIKNPAIYQLMFGSTLWKSQQSTQALKEVAYPSFQYQVEMTEILQKKGLMPKGETSLRLAQVSWATLHGLAQLLIDGVYTEASHIDEMCECAINILLLSPSKYTKV